jgi:xylulokinase
LTGIKAGTPVANGSADCSTAALGAGMIDSGQVTLIIGTAGVVAVCSDQPLPDSRDRTLCWHYCLRDKWVILGITQTAGESLNWFKNAFDQTADSRQGSVDIFEQYNTAIQEVPDGADGLIFLPYLNGERTPYWDSAARGVYFGINLGTSKAHFIKAIMEGVSFALRHCVETVESLGIRIDQIMAVGGGLKSTNWLNTLGRIMRKPIRTVSLPDTGLVGNMLVCAQALGLIGSIPEAVGRIVNFNQEIHYPEGHEVYEKQYSQFLALYDNLKERFQIASR